MGTVFDDVIIVPISTICFCGPAVGDSEERFTSSFKVLAHVHEALVDEVRKSLVVYVMALSQFRRGVAQCHLNGSWMMCD